MSTYSDVACVVNRDVDPGEIEIPAFLPRRSKQAASPQPRRRIPASVWSTVRARVAREHESLPEDSPRLKPTLPKLRLLEPSEGAAWWL